MAILWVRRTRVQHQKSLHHLFLPRSSQRKVKAQRFFFKLTLWYKPRSAFSTRQGCRRNFTCVFMSKSLLIHSQSSWNSAVTLTHFLSATWEKQFDFCISSPPLCTTGLIITSSPLCWVCCISSCQISVEGEGVIQGYASLAQYSTVWRCIFRRV